MESHSTYTLQQIGELLSIPVKTAGENRSEQEFPKEIREYCIDSRQVFHPEATLFIALGGKRDGHDFIRAAWERGVRNFLISRAESAPESGNYMVVPNTLAAFQHLAGHHRDQFAFPVIAITGSNGKTIVKEWLASVLAPDFQIGKSPKSFNSQIGVALSVLGTYKDQDQDQGQGQEQEQGKEQDLSHFLETGTARVGIFEAGISKMGEMERLKRILRPDIGILTHFGDAHAEGFESMEQKLEEKLKLFEGVEVLLLSADDEEVLGKAGRKGITLKTVGKAIEADLRVENVKDLRNGWAFELVEKASPHQKQQFQFPQAGPAALENILLVILAARHLGLSLSTIARRITGLHPVSMRMELITDNPEITLINDAYNADLASIQNAFSLLNTESNQAHKAIILTDIEHQGERQEAVQRHILDLILNQSGPNRIPKRKLFLIGPVFERIARNDSELQAFRDTDAFLRQFEYAHFRRNVVLLKGARHFQLERIIPYLSQRVTATEFRINMDHLRHNYLQFRSLLPANVKIMAMVKAFSYGSGSWEIAQALELEGVDYLAVAYTAEGITLRNGGIYIPIMVMNPDLSALEQLFRFNLEPEVYSLGFLRELMKRAEDLHIDTVRVHLKVDTGMHRLGFSASDLPALKAFLQTHPNIEIVSILSHLAAADEAKNDAYTLAQIAAFQKFCTELEFPKGKPALHHILNTAGILRFPDYALDMVRLGIGLYGIAPFPDAKINLKEIGSLHSVVSQVHEYEAGAPIGYGLSDKLKRQSTIATVPVGYADGIRRSLSNGKMSFLIHGKRAPIIGRVCMDMLMLDVSDIPSVQAGDEVVLIGRQGSGFISVNELAEKSETIPYEILTSISQRVRRVYSRE